MAKDVIHVLKRGLRLLPSPTDWPNVDDLRDLFDLGAVKTALENRRDLTVDEIQQIVNWFEAAWQQASQQVEDWSSALWQLARDRFTPQAETLDAAREQVVERIAAAQTAVQTRATDLKADVQRQADAARRQVAIAAWWLFLSLLSSGGGSGDRRLARRQVLEWSFDIWPTLTACGTSPFEGYDLNLIQIQKWSFGMWETSPPAAPLLLKERFDKTLIPLLSKERLGEVLPDQTKLPFST